MAQLLERVIDLVPPPQKSEKFEGAKALIFDSLYDSYRGVVAYIRMMDGSLKRGDKIRFLNTKAEAEVLEVGHLQLKMEKDEELSEGEVGYLITGVKAVHDARVGDTVWHKGNTSLTPDKVKPLPGYKKVMPFVFASIYCNDGSDFPLLRDALEKKKQSICFSSQELDEKIDNTKREIDDFEQMKDQFRKEFDCARKSTTTSINDVIDSHISIIAQKYALSEDAEDDISSLVQDLQIVTKDNIESLNRKINAESFHIVDLVGVLDSTTADLKSIKILADYVVSAATFALTVWIVPGASTALEAAEGGVAITTTLLGRYGKKAAAGAAKSANKAFWKKTAIKTLGALSEVIKDVNPLEHLENYILPRILRAKLKEDLSQRVQNSIYLVFDDIRLKLVAHLDNEIGGEIRDRQAVLRDLRKARNDTTYDERKELYTLNSDLNMVKDLCTQFEEA